MKMKKSAIYFDMDGTIADFYNVDGWLDYLKNENTTPYDVAKSRVNENDFVNLVSKLKAVGFTIGIISWSARDGSKEYNKAVRKSKVKWCKYHYGDIFDEFHVVKYGTPKHQVANIKNSILIDDNADVRNAWKNGITIDANNCEEMMKQLELLVA